MPGSQDYKLRVIGRDGLAQWRVLSVLPVRKPEPPPQMLQELLEVLRTFGDYIQAETLAVDLTAGGLDSQPFRAEATFGDQWLKAGITRASR